MMVRAAVLKMKDPKQIIRDMEKLDEMGEQGRYWVLTIAVKHRVCKWLIIGLDGEDFLKIGTESGLKLFH